MRTGTNLARATLCTLLLSAYGCVGPGGSWGAGATLGPGWDAVRQGASEAARSPHTWAPLIGAAVFAAGNLDRETLEWTQRHHPLFGSRSAAKDASDLLRDLSEAHYLVTALAAPSPDLAAKGRGLAAGLAARVMSDQLTQQLKRETGRKRPDRNSRNSFPSSHTSQAAASAALAARNIPHFAVAPGARRAWRWSAHALAALTGYARVEAERHYPTDVLVGYALGSFVSEFVSNAFLGPGGARGFSVAVRPARRGLVVEVSARL